MDTGKHRSFERVRLFLDLPTNWLVLMLFFGGQVVTGLLADLIPRPRLSYGSLVGIWCAFLGIGFVIFGRKKVTFPSLRSV